MLQHAVVFVLVGALCCSSAVAMTISSLSSTTRRFANINNNDNISSSPMSCLDRVRQAMATTTESSMQNIVLIEKACDQWYHALYDKDSGQLSPKVRGIGYALYGSCLTQVGQDLHALSVFDECLALTPYLANETIHDATLGKALALQRLMRYEHARQTFLRLCLPTASYSDERACAGAATCSLRLLDIEGAERILTDQTQGNNEHVSANLLGMLGATLYLRATKEMGLSEQSWKSLELGASVSPLYRWVLCCAAQSGSHERVSRMEKHAYDFLQLAIINQSPFDDPYLIHLDDKVFLHELLSTSAEASEEDISFWPDGYILPREESAWIEQEASDQSPRNAWILKQRAGYGSHGNQLVVPTQHAFDNIKSLLTNVGVEGMGSSSLLLCQRMVHPPLLLQGRKFTLRLYVLYFMESGSSPQPNVYLATNGLVKLASIPYREGKESDDRMHMTNSGREESMLQQDLTFLRNELEISGGSFEDVWEEIGQAVKVVMHKYQDNVRRQAPHAMYRSKLESLGIPKILGFDFIMDANQKVKLLEVNRFPGLEPRGTSDRDVKYAVVRGAWVIAAHRLGLDITQVHILEGGESVKEEDYFSLYEKII